MLHHIIIWKSSKKHYMNISSILKFTLIMKKPLIKQKRPDAICINTVMLSILDKYIFCTFKIEPIVNII